MRLSIKPSICTIIAILAFPQVTFAASKTLLVGGFQDIVIDGDMQVVVVTGKTPSGTATGDLRMLDRLRLERQSDAITVRMQRPPSNDNAVRITEPLIVTISTRSLRNIVLRGNAKLKVNAVSQYDGSRIYLDGGGEINIDQLKADTLDVTLSGQGKLRISGGTARASNVLIQGASVYDAANLKTRSLMLNQNGNATSSAQVEEGATISNEGAGNITITGRAECFIRKAGFAVISCPSDKKRSRSN